MGCKQIVWLPCHKMAVNGFKWAEYLSVFNKDFMNSYNEKCNEGYFLEIDVLYSENLHAIYNDLPFLPEVRTVNKVKKACGQLTR